ncbi:hypothetical protein ACFSL6_01840 [Paenibacillus thailandensis]|uniref:hypothetical protein n=1 Tax=Paenibacillus thailandensis TaxID=393250 RepID=UPI00363F6D8D
MFAIRCQVDQIDKLLCPNIEGSETIIALSDLPSFGDLNITLEIERLVQPAAAAEPQPSAFPSTAITLHS